MGDGDADPALAHGIGADRSHRLAAACLHPLWLRDLQEAHPIGGQDFCGEGARAHPTPVPPQQRVLPRAPRGKRNGRARGACTLWFTIPHLPARHFGSAWSLAVSRVASQAVRQQQDDHSPHPLRFRVKQPSPFGYMWQPTQDVYKFQSGHKEAAIWQTPGGAELNGSDTPLQRLPRPGEWMYRHAW